MNMVADITDSSLVFYAGFLPLLSILFIPLHTYLFHLRPLHHDNNIFLPPSPTSSPLNPDHLIIGLSLAVMFTEAWIIQVAFWMHCQISAGNLQQASLKYCPATGDGWGAEMGMVMWIMGLMVLVGAVVYIGLVAHGIRMGKKERARSGVLVVSGWGEVEGKHLDGEAMRI